MSVLRSAIRLADGRDLIYFDDNRQDGRDSPDRRRLPPGNPQSELRYDPFQRTWVIYARHRQDRSYLPTAADCPLCPSAEGRLTEIPAHDSPVVVFENRFPALTQSTTAGPAGSDGDLFVARPSAGRCEVICYTSDHDASFADLSSARVRLVTEALIDRTQQLSALPGVEQVFCFENRGREIGVTQPHPHGQIYAYPYVTPRTAKMLGGVAEYACHTGRNLFDDALAAERADGSRLVLTSDHWVAFVPHAARWPYEVHCYPVRRVPDLASLRPDERDELAIVQLDLMRRFARLFDQPAPYIAGWHQAPTRTAREDFALHLELFTVRRSNDKLKYLAGSESGMDAFANDILPEQAASRLRELG
jgi:UDPglucose--hexose-1-phosphate uridylyltransferase